MSVLNDIIEEPYEEEVVVGGGTIEDKIDLITLSNGWNDKNERIVISIGENAASYKWMHERSSYLYKTINQIFSILLIVFSTTLSAATLIPQQDTTLPLDISQQVITYILTLLSVIQNFLKFEQLSEQHLNASSEFSKLYHDIQQQMCMYRRHRNNATTYVTSILKHYDSLVVNGPQIHTRVIAQFKNAFKSSDISLPDIADKIQKIEIISEPLQARLFNNNVARSKDTKRHGMYGMNNLDQIHSVFQIHGDISDKDIENASTHELQQLKSRFLSGKSNFEFNRFLQHTLEND